MTSQSKQEFALKLKNARIQAGLTQAQVADKLGITYQAISNYERGVNRIEVETLLKLCEIYNIDINELLPDDNLPNNIYPYNPTMYQIPILGTISAGLPMYAEQNVEGYIWIDLGSDRDYFALRVNGNSMNAARINDQDVLIVHKQCTVENGQIAVVLVGNEDAVVKRFYRNGNNVTLVPQSNDPKYLPQIYDITKTKIQVIGRVVRNQIDF